jgi:hypothetical protein
MLEDIHNVKINVIHAGFPYSIGRKNSERYRDSAIFHQNGKPTVWLYLHRDELTNTLELQKRSMLPNPLPAQREVIFPELPALKVPVRAYNTVSLLISTNDAETLNRFGRTNDRSHICYPGVDPLEVMAFTHEINASHPTYEFLRALRQRSSGQQYTYVLEPYMPDSRRGIARVSHKELKCGSLIRNLGLDWPNARSLLWNYFPSYENYTNARHQERRWVVQGKISKGFNAGRPSPYNRCFNDPFIIKALEGEDKATYEEARNMILKYKTDITRALLIIYTHFFKRDVRIITSKTPAYVDKQLKVNMLNRYFQPRAYTTHNAVVLPTCNMLNAVLLLRNDLPAEDQRPRVLLCVPSRTYYPHEDQGSGDIYLKMVKCNLLSQDTPKVNKPPDWYGFPNLRQSPINDEMVRMYHFVQPLAGSFRDPFTTQFSSMSTRLKEPIFTHQPRPESYLTWDHSPWTGFDLSNYTEDFGSNGNDCVYRLLSHVTGYSIEAYMRSDEKIHSLVHTLKYILYSSNCAEVEQPVRRCLDLTSQALGRLNNNTYYARDTEKIQAWENHLRLNQGRIDLLALKVLCYIHHVNMVLTYNGHTIGIIPWDTSMLRTTTRVIAAEKPNGSTHVLLITSGAPENVRTDWTDQYSTVEYFLRHPMGAGDEPNALTAATNDWRHTNGQESLIPRQEEYDFDAQAHDPGEFRQMSTLNLYANQVRAHYGQPPLEDSQASSDVNMYRVKFHDPDPELLLMDPTGSTLDSRIERYFGAACRDYDNDYSADDAASNAAETTQTESESQPVAYLSRIEASKSTSVSMLFDSGATRHIVGKGIIQQRFDQNKQVLYNHPTLGTVEPGEMTRNASNAKRTPTRVIVASGDSKYGVQTDRIDINVQGQLANDLKSKHPEVHTVHLTLNNPVISPHILTDVISETYLLRSHPEFMVVSQGINKYILIGEITITVAPLHGMQPIKIPLRYEDGAHYLDINSVVRNRSDVKWKDEYEEIQPNINLREDEGEPQPRINMIRTVGTETENDTHSSTLNITETYSEVVRANRIYSPSD